MEKNGYNRPELHAASWSWVIEQPLYYRCARQHKDRGGEKMANQGALNYCFFFFFLLAIRVNIQYHFILASGVQHSG